jgi:hypothetical protein
MLKDLTTDQARLVARLAKAARAQRDTLLGNTAEDDLAKEMNPARGEHNPAAALGFDPLSPSASQVLELREAIATLSPMARSELYALVRIGQGDLGAKEWLRGLSEASLLGDETIAAAIVEDPDLHDHIMKALYEAERAARA